MKKLGKTLLTFLIIGIILLVIINITENADNTENKSKANIFERKATLEDINIDVSYKFPVSVKVTVTPTVDIKDLELELIFYNSAGHVVYSKYIEYGTVSAGRHYEESVSVFDLDISIIATKGTHFFVSRGTASIFE